MLAVRCALLTALLAAPGAALVPGVCPALGKGLARTWWAEPTGGWGKPLWPPQMGLVSGLREGRRGEGSRLPWLAWVPAATRCGLRVAQLFRRGRGRGARVLPAACCACGGALSAETALRPGSALRSTRRTCVFSEI